MAQVSYLFLAFNLSFNLFKVIVKQKEKSHSAAYFYTIFDAISKFWLLFNCLIQPTPNLLVMSLWQIKEHLLGLIISDLIASIERQKLENNFTLILCFYTIVGQMCYFSQGNTNSLNTIQISSGLVGINELNMLVVAFLMLASTYGSNIYWYFVTLKHLFSQHKINHIFKDK